ncbi:MAG: flavodoxin domain-containing protein [Candidatus Thermoplasmatota archaeon]
MGVVVAYDSVFGNTEKIAMAIGGALPPDTRVAKADLVDASALAQATVLVIGSPTHGGRPTESVKGLLGRITEGRAKGLKVAAFDTRIPGKFPKIFGYAADRIAADLTAKGAVLLVPPEPFYVKGRNGPLKDGELEHAAQWAKKLSQ